MGLIWYAGLGFTTPQRIAEIEKAVTVAHVAALYEWEQEQPPRWKVRRWRRWKESRPTVDRIREGIIAAVEPHGVNCRHTTPTYQLKAEDLPRHPVVQT